MYKRPAGETEVKEIVDRFIEKHENIPPLEESKQQNQE